MKIKQMLNTRGVAKMSLEQLGNDHGQEVGTGLQGEAAEVLNTTKKRRSFTAA